MKKVKLCAVIFSLTAMLCGCTKTIDLTEKETDMLAEYISKEVLERDKCYEQGLITPELVSDKDDDRDNDVVQPVEQEDKSEQNQIVTPSKKPEVTNKPEELKEKEEEEKQEEEQRKKEQKKKEKKDKDKNNDEEDNLGAEPQS